AFLETGRDDIVATADIGQQILEHVAVAGAIPHVMVRIDDRQIGLDDLFAALVKPVLPDRGMTARRDGGLGHGSVPPGFAVRLYKLCSGTTVNATVFDEAARRTGSRR